MTTCLRIITEKFSLFKFEDDGRALELIVLTFNANSSLSPGDYKFNQGRTVILIFYFKPFTSLNAYLVIQGKRSR